LGAKASNELEGATNRPLLSLREENAYFQEAIARGAQELAPLFEAGAFNSLMKGTQVFFEYPFLYGLGPWIIEGRMDFLAKGETDIIVLDLKTDLRVSPSDYAIQLALYHAAAACLFRKKNNVLGSSIYIMAKSCGLKQSLTEKGSCNFVLLSHITGTRFFECIRMLIGGSMDRVFRVFLNIFLKIAM